ncbi:bacillithiol system redox-active protein YtxJ [Algoriphagus formosus]|jgi:bacillithiol system protein YtxJ|uniref:Bacillithiol system redox-active protein YtxJ n=1 Tax=Algoriphagus formosus TaxID=2007308 RepID=A0A4R5UXY7_9BACT|nr:MULTISPECIES: bacillithiol system redox-active protein YtxJ [Algoriphagus]MCR9081330.1 bacillithiol system redox-active protein YtxJ [Cyclobacteriaceae bacterium]TDK44230.1 bacillithiol system redox-active protein YtxJ [Algoriphagus aquimaris]
MNWQKLTDPGQIDVIKQQSKDMPVLIFKHSTRCSISSMSLDRLARNWKKEDEQRLIPYFLDLIAFRSLSDQVAMDFGVPHQSPQAILIKDGKVVFEDSHFGISYNSIMAKI